MGELLRHPGKEPFPEQNTLRLLHGLYSSRVRRPVEDRYADALRAAMREGLGRVYSEVLDEHAIRRAARALATVDMVEHQIDEHGLDDLSERVIKDYHRCASSADKWLGELGLTPSARARLGVDAAKTVDLIEAIERRRGERAQERLCDTCGAVARYRVKGGGRLCSKCAQGRPRPRGDGGWISLLNLLIVPIAIAAFFIGLACLWIAVKL